jgi:acyl carrier protein
LQQRFRSETYTCKLRTLSDIIREQGIERIDLLKVDVEKSEWDVLAGIRSEDWGKIRQVVLEVETPELMERVSTLLDSKGYSYVIDEVLSVEADGAGTGVHVYMCYAVRRDEQSPLSTAATVSDAGRLTADAFESKLNPRPNVSVTALREHLQEKLPAYMIPSSFIFLKALPLTPNGKIDVAALPDPEGLRPNIETEYVAPRNETEAMVADVWRELLQLEHVGIDDNFFEVGGTSLLLLRLRNRLQELSGKNIPIVEMLRYPTVGALAAFLGMAQTRTLPTQKLQGRANKSIEAVNQQKQLMEQRRKAKSGSNGGRSKPRG